MNKTNKYFGFDVSFDSLVDLKADREYELKSS